jgi:hypothetical protein
MRRVSLSGRGGKSVAVAVVELASRTRRSMASQPTGRALEVRGPLTTAEI